MKGILLAGGLGSRLDPLTRAVSKQLLPVYDKPMIYYPLCTLMLAGISDILIVTTSRDVHLFHDLLGDGKQWGINLSYAIQDRPDGIAQAFIIGRDFIGRDECCLILGDNIFYGQPLPTLLQDAAGLHHGGVVFAYRVKTPEQYGIVEFDSNGIAISIDEKPRYPRSHYAVPGLYFYDNRVVGFAELLRPSSRGELEITDINRAYLAEGTLRVNIMGRGMAWFDTGTHESLFDAGLFVQSIQERQGLKIACPEEIAFRMGYIDAYALERLAHNSCKNGYGTYLLGLCRDLYLSAEVGVK